MVNLNCQLRTAQSDSCPFFLPERAAHLRPAGFCWLTKVMHVDELPPLTLTSRFSFSRRSGLLLISKLLFHQEPRKREIGMFFSKKHSLIHSHFPQTFQFRFLVWCQMFSQRKEDVNRAFCFCHFRAVIASLEAAWLAQSLELFFAANAQMPTHIHNQRMSLQMKLSVLF